MKSLGSAAENEAINILVALQWLDGFKSTAVGRMRASRAARATNHGPDRRLVDATAPRSAAGR